MILHRINPDTMKTHCGKKLSQVKYVSRWTLTTCPNCYRYGDTRLIRRKIIKAQKRLDQYGFSEDIYGKGTGRVWTDPF